MLLAVDTSTQWIGLALYDGVSIAAEQTWLTHNHHTVELAPALDALFKRSGIRPTDLQAQGVALGPGSFTSLRIGLAVAKGIGLALHIPVYGIPTLDILAASQPPSDLPLVAVLQAGRQRLAVSTYHHNGERWQSDGEVSVCTLEALSNTIHSPTIFCGELNEDARRVLRRKYRNAMLVSPAQSLRRPAYLAEMAWERWQSGQPDEVKTLSPIYLHVAGSIPDQDH